MQTHKGLKKKVKKKRRWKWRRHLPLLEMRCLGCDAPSRESYPFRSVERLPRFDSDRPTVRQRRWRPANVWDRFLDGRRAIGPCCTGHQRPWRYNTHSSSSFFHKRIMSSNEQECLPSRFLSYFLLFIYTRLHKYDWLARQGTAKTHQTLVCPNACVCDYYFPHVPSAFILFSSSLNYFHLPRLFTHGRDSSL